jgi:hypothetical protein
VGLSAKSTPPGVRVLFAVYAVCFLGAGLNHAHDIWQGGLFPYRDAPPLLNAYWTSLTVLDPLAVLLLYRRPRAGMVLAVLIMVSDVALNSYAVYVLDESVWWRAAVTLQVQTLFLGFVAGSVPFAWRRVGSPPPAKAGGEGAGRAEEQVKGNPPPPAL